MLIKDATRILYKDRVMRREAWPEHSHVECHGDQLEYVETDEKGEYRAQYSPTTKDLMADDWRVISRRPPRLLR